MFSLHRFDLKYVQVVNSPGTYGEEAATELVKHARQSGVCVAQTITLPSRDLTRESADRVVQVYTSFQNSLSKYSSLHCRIKLLERFFTSRLYSSGVKNSHTNMIEP